MASSLSAERRVFSPTPEGKPRWSESLLPWLLASFLLVALLIALWVRVSPPKPVRFKSAEERNKTFQIMPEPVAPRQPSLARPRTSPPALTQPRRLAPSAPERPVPRHSAPLQPKVAASKPRPIAPHRAEETPSAPAEPQTPAPPSETKALPRIPLGTLEEQMDQAARQATASPPLPKFKNPSGPVADFYIAGWIQKLERIGDLNYPGDLVGNLKVTVVLDPKGDLERIILNQSSGNPELDAAAERIIRLSLPYTPFSEQLRRQTRRIEIPLNMHFLGVRRVSAW